MSTMSFLDQPMSASPGYRFGTFVRIIPLSPLSHFSLAAHLSDLRPREIMTKNMIDLDSVPAKRTTVLQDLGAGLVWCCHVHHQTNIITLRSDSAAFLCAQLEKEKLPNPG
ncbi:hypothetical protein GE21DRAFT_4658 [Neurospora crassa]|uniref:Uncharacterized protein n=1 Tax=Neurospora crassa (strain ATCC 24698 / 74-OR23-1A / CBS 708.71 / DSM 1257 / FGSC 987) TaxID=367110 RepID=Q7RZM2_NEUCR|nr:hypothetical protein NCU00343 [Neurospora crassa OR74A]EAA28578.2 hypothetical protein NCU00343 [Neurospora crassa OR74A]KHE89552.1 hypothetical protein GE21DRAFT_4658 [Neurospora crassa]|eukprot:XP_957814.2 hypothetical protein NCU00343 [Neurospora crassa OR74A]